jgi:hypothetical protein
MNSFNDDNNINNEDEDKVRSPDKVKREKLIDEFSYNDLEESDDDEFNYAIHLSINEFQKQEELNKKFEDELINNYHNLIKERKEIFHPLLLELIRLSKYDKEIKEIYEILKPIIDSYCLQNIEFIDLDAITYTKIFNTLSSLRVDKNSIEILKTIIIKHI